MAGKIDGLGCAGEDAQEVILVRIMFTGGRIRCPDRLRFGSRPRADMIIGEMVNIGPSGHVFRGGMTPGDIAPVDMVWMPLVVHMIQFSNRVV